MPMVPRSCTTNASPMADSNLRPRSCGQRPSFNSQRMTREPRWDTDMPEPHLLGISGPPVTTARSRRLKNNCPGALRRAVFDDENKDPELERQEVAGCIEALFKHRKATLRFLRRCEQPEELLALQDALDPQPRRVLSGNRRTSSIAMMRSNPSVQPSETVASRCGTPRSRCSTPRGRAWNSERKAPFAFADCAPAFLCSPDANGDVNIEPMRAFAFADTS
mmetsp:Transcript_108332/g.170860  ORF Transcript_108332/g.170860 Transcript_108332/m.170860 type:complete len:221 (-) Transcript_108332:194-856(-)